MTVKISGRIMIFLGGFCCFLFSAAADDNADPLNSVRQALLEALSVDAPLYAPEELAVAEDFFKQAVAAASSREQQKHIKKSIAAAKKAYKQALPYYIKSKTKQFELLKEKLAASVIERYAPVEYSAIEEQIAEAANRLIAGNTDTATADIAEITQKIDNAVSVIVEKQQEIAALQKLSVETLEANNEELEEEQRQAAYRLIANGDEAYNKADLSQALKDYQSAVVLIETLAEQNKRNFYRTELAVLADTVQKEIETSANLFVLDESNEFIMVPQWSGNSFRAGNRSRIVPPSADNEALALYTKAINLWYDGVAAREADNLDEAGYFLNEALDYIKNFKQSATVNVYQVVADDTLWLIAARPTVYDNRYLWPLIWQHNQRRVPNPDLIFPRQQLLIPPFVP
jgi:nucleoid-associated protein YgaU